MNKNNIASIIGFWAVFLLLNHQISDFTGVNTRYYWIMNGELFVLSIMAFLRGYNSHKFYNYIKHLNDEED
jgi:hypothetical membrane protein